jgi:hypothetical protein
MFLVVLAMGVTAGPCTGISWSGLAMGLAGLSMAGPALPMVSAVQAHGLGLGGSGLSMDWSGPGLGWPWAGHAPVSP